MVPGSLQVAQTIELNVKDFTRAFDLKSLPPSTLFIVTAPKGYTLDLFVAGYYGYGFGDLDTKMENYHFYDSNFPYNYVGTWVFSRQGSLETQLFQCLGFAMAYNDESNQILFVQKWRLNNVKPQQWFNKLSTWNRVFPFERRLVLNRKAHI